MGELLELGHIQLVGLERKELRVEFGLGSGLPELGDLGEEPSGG